MSRAGDDPGRRAGSHGRLRWLAMVLVAACTALIGGTVAASGATGSKAAGGIHEIGT